MKEGDKTVEQSVAVEVQGEAPAPQSVRGPVAPVPTAPVSPMQISTQMA